VYTGQEHRILIWKPEKKPPIGETLVEMRSQRNRVFRVWVGFSCLRIGTHGEHLWTRWRTFEFHKRWRFLSQMRNWWILLHGFSDSVSIERCFVGVTRPETVWSDKFVVSSNYLHPCYSARLFTFLERKILFWRFKETLSVLYASCCLSLCHHRIVPTQLFMTSQNEIQSIYRTCSITCTRVFTT
jgi:hypothetical protein